MSVEIQCEGRKNKVWHHENDKILNAFCTIHDENAFINLGEKNYFYYKFIITTNKNQNFLKRKNASYIIAPEYNGYKNNNYIPEKLIEVIPVSHEISLIGKFIEIFLKYDPDIIVGYETEILSIAYILRRADFLGIKIYNFLSREFFEERFDEEKIKREIEKNIYINRNINSNNNLYDDPKKIKYLEQKFGKIIKLKGRIIINLWRILSHELKLIDYSIENVVFSVLKIREPVIENEFLLKFVNSDKPNDIIFGLDYFMKRCEYNLKIIEELDLITREAQFTRSIIFFP